MTNRFILKLLTHDQWLAFEAEQKFTGAPVDIEDGYIHFSTGEQVAETAKKYFSDLVNVYVVQIDTEKLPCEVKWEPSRGGALFPHLYAELPFSAVSRVDVLNEDSSGKFKFPEWALAS